MSHPSLEYEECVSKPDLIENNARVIYFCKQQQLWQIHCLQQSSSTLSFLHSNFSIVQILALWNGSYRFPSLDGGKWVWEPSFDSWPLAGVIIPNFKMIFNLLCCVIVIPCQLAWHFSYLLGWNVKLKQNVNQVLKKLNCYA